MDLQERFSDKTVLAGKYKVLRFLGRGGVGDVYLVCMTQGVIQGPLAMKVLRSKHIANERYLEQFKHEIRITMRIVSKYVVPIRDVGTLDDGRVYYTMDYIEGSSLAEIIRREGRIGPQRTVRIGRRVLTALISAHELGIIHRDLKPANIMTGRRPDGRDRVYVLDFGLAAPLHRKPGRACIPAGTKRYMAPEQFRGENLTPATDIHGVGVVFYECLTGRPPYEGRSAREIYAAMRRGPVPIEQLAPAVRARPGLAQIVHKALAFEPEKRWPSARRFLDALRPKEHDPPRPVKRGKPSETGTSLQSRYLRRRRTSRRPLLYGVSIFVFMAACVLALKVLIEKEGAYNLPSAKVSAHRDEGPRVSEKRTVDVSEPTSEGQKEVLPKPAPAVLTHNPETSPRTSDSEQISDLPASPPSVLAEPKPAVPISPVLNLRGDIGSRPILKVALSGCGSRATMKVVNERSGFVIEETRNARHGKVSWEPEIYLPPGETCELTVTVTDADSGQSETKRFRIETPPLVLTPPAHGLLIDTDYVNSAILRGARYLRGAAASYVKDLSGRPISRDPNEAGIRNAWGTLALMTFALVQSGVPYCDPVVKSSFDRLHKLPLDWTYFVSCYGAALMAVFAQFDEIQRLVPSRSLSTVRKHRTLWRSRVKKRFSDCVNFLVREQRPAASGGGWSYRRSGGQVSDLSNTHFAVLVLAAAPRWGCKVPRARETWRALKKFLLKRLAFEDGGRAFTLQYRGEKVKTYPELPMKPFWYSEGKEGDKWNMTCAGLSVAFMIGEWEKRSELTRPAFAWLAGHWRDPPGLFYGAYVLEKLGSAAELERIDGHDWFAELAEYFCGTQTSGGFWEKGGDYNGATTIQKSSFALLTLGRSTESLLGRRYQREVVTAKENGRVKNDSNWIRAGDRYYHVPTLIRRVYLAPDLLLNTLEIVVRNSPRGRQGEFIPVFADLLDEVANQKTRRRIYGILKEITACEYHDSDAYRQWFAKWKTIEYGPARRDLEEDRIGSYIGRLLKVRENEKSAVLREALLRRLGGLRTPRAIPACLEDMAHRLPSVREAAAECLRSIFAGYTDKPYVPPPFDPKARGSKRRKQLETVKKWFETARATWLRGWCGDPEK